MPDPASQDDVIGEYAGFITRMVAFVADLVIIIALIASMTAVAGLLQDFFRFGEYTTKVLDFGVGAISLILLQTYFIFFWMLAGQTPGKLTVGLRVVRTDGGRVTIGVAVRRIVGYYISAFLLLGYLSVLWNNDRQGWHDRLAGTYVVYAWSHDKDLQRGRPLRGRAETRAQRPTRKASQQAGT